LILIEAFFEEQGKRYPIKKQKTASKEISAALQ